MENNYYIEVNHLINKLEVNKKARYLSDNSETLNTYWNIGKLLVDAQGGEARAKYSNALIKEWSVKLTKEYGKGYDSTNLRKFRQFYLTLPKCATLWRVLTWSHYRTILTIKDENKRNYYINLCINNNLSVRELIKEIKSNSYERLLNKPEHIEIIENNNYINDVREYIKNPILIALNDDEKILKEKDLQRMILAKLKNFFSELGQGFTFIDNEYKIKYGNKNYYIDLLLFNYELNSFVVVELKTRELRKEDKAQMEFYMNLVDNNLKRDFHNKTIGIIVSKEQDKYIVSFVSNDSIIPITYKLYVKESI